MATTYRAAFGDPKAQAPVLATLLPVPDTSCDAALARALAEDEQAASRAPHGAATSPSGIRVHVAGDWRDEKAAQQPPAQHATGAVRAPAKSGGGSGGSPAHVSGKTSTAGAAPQPLLPSDSELARQLQRVEIQAVKDATGVMPSSLLFPGLISQPSSREAALARTLSRVPSVQGSPHVLAAAALALHEPVVSADRQRLLATLKLYDLCERQVAGDGNCQFRALSDQLYGSPDHHANVRAAVVATLRRREGVYKHFVLNTSYGEYCASMGKSGTWGDHLTLQAAADSYGVKITVVSSFAEAPVINIDPDAACASSSRQLFLSFWAEVHYNSLYSATEPPPQQSGRESPPPQKPPKVLGSRVLGRVVQQVEDVLVPK